MSRSGQNTEECRKLEASTETQSLQVVGKAGFLNGKSKGCVHQLKARHTEEKYRIGSICGKLGH